MRNQFEVLKETFATSTVDEYINNNILPTFDSIDFSPDDSTPNLWHGKYLSRSACCCLLLFVKEERNSFIIEISKIRGDAKPFAEFFSALKALFIPRKNDGGLQQQQQQQSPHVFNFGTLACRPLSDEEFLNGLQPVFRMSKASNFEARLESAKMFCDLFQYKQSQLQSTDIRTACVASVELLIKDIFPEIQEIAVMAMSLMAEVDDNYRMEWMRSSALLVVTKMVVETPKSPSLNYETIQVRRECAKILVTLAAESNAHLLKECIVEQAEMEDDRFFEKWMVQVQSIKDSRLRHWIEMVFPAI